MARQDTLSVSSDIDIAAGIHGDAGGNIEGTRAELACPDFAARGAVLAQERVRPPGVCLARQGVFSPTSDIDIATGIHGDASGIIKATRAELARPDVSVVGVRLGGDEVRRRDGDRV